MENQPTMSSDMRKLFKVLNHEVTKLHAIWELFIQLYGSSEENISLMNESAPQFFAILKGIFFDEFMLILNRLTEKAVVSGKATASLEQLITHIDKNLYAQLAKNLKTRLEKIRKNFKAFKIWRDKNISHNELSIALSREADPLPHITRGQTEAAIKELVDFMNEFSITLTGGEQAYHPFMTAKGDGNALMQYIKIASDFQKKSN